MEHTAEIGLISETDLSRNRTDGFVRVCKQLLGLKYAVAVQILPRGNVQLAVKDTADILPYFLNDWECFKHIPLGVLAHSTHVRGSGVMDAERGIEKPNVRVTLASKISAEDCVRLCLGYLDPAAINIDDWKDKEDEGILYVPKAGEILYRLKT